VSTSASPLPDDPSALKMLLEEERAENERLRQIIKAMQRHRFGRRAESLPEDQLLLGLEEAEQTEAGAALGLCAGRPDLGRNGSAWGRLRLCPRSDQRAPDGASVRLSRDPAGGRL
jgi:hypothetical protein